MVVLIRLDALVLFLEVSSPEKWDLLMGTLGGGGIKSRTGEVGMIKLWTKREREGCVLHTLVITPPEAADAHKLPPNPFQS